MKLIKIVLAEPDDTYELQAAIIDELIDRLGIARNQVIDTTEDHIVIEVSNPAQGSKASQVLRQSYGRNIDFHQSAFCGDGGGGDAGGATSGGADSSGGAVSSGASADTGNTRMGSYQGFGNANLRGVTMHKYQGDKVALNVDNIIDEPSFYKEGAPEVKFSEGVGYLYLPTEQETYSLGEMTVADVNRLNQKFESNLREFSSSFDDNKGNPTTIERSVQVDYLKPNHTTYDDYINSNADKNAYIRAHSDARSWDARDPERVPYRYNTVRDWDDMITSGERSDKRTVPTLKMENLPCMPATPSTALPTCKDELVQRLLCFSDADFYEDSFHYVRQAMYGDMTPSDVMNKVSSGAKAIQKGVNTVNNIRSAVGSTLMDKGGKALSAGWNIAMKAGSADWKKSSENLFGKWARDKKDNNDNKSTSSNSTPAPTSTPTNNNKNN